MNRIFNSENIIAYIRNRFPDEKLLVTDGMARRLKLICENINRNNMLNRAGQKILIRQMSDNIANNILVRDAVLRNPGIHAVNIDKPIFIIGLPRTGTTLLHKLMALDKDNRILKVQEALKPAIVENGKIINREKYAESWISNMNRVIRETEAMIDISLESPVECCFLKRNTLRCHSISYQAKLDLLEKDWFDRENLTECYDFYKLQLKLIQYQSHARRWLLKCPSHFPAIEQIFSAFPDATLVCTHRDMGEVIASFTSLISTIRSGLAKTLSKEAVAVELIDSLQTQIRIHYEYRRHNPALNITDINYTNLMKDPIGCVREIYQKNHIPYSTQFERKMSGWLRKNQQDKREKHIYSLSMFGLTNDIVQKLCGDSRELN